MLQRARTIRWNTWTQFFVCTRMCNVVMGAPPPIGLCKIKKLTHLSDEHGSVDATRLIVCVDMVIKNLPGFARKE